MLTLKRLPCKMRLFNRFRSNAHIQVTSQKAYRRVRTKKHRYLQTFSLMCQLNVSQILICDMRVRKMLTCQLSN